MEEQKPFFELSIEKALEQYKIVERLSDTVSYSSKTNPVLSPILEEKTNCLFSIHMINELKNIKDKKRILFLAQGWDKQEISRLLSLGVFRFAVDNDQDLNLLLDFIEENNNDIELFLRAKLKENSVKSERYFVFGLESEVINEKVKILKENNHIKLLGLHFHKKTQNIAEWNMISEIEEMFNDETFERTDYLNIGGGLPSVYANTNTKIFDYIYKQIKELKEWLNEKKIKLMIEPGRFISAPSTKLITHIKTIYDNNIIVDASIYNSDMDAILVPVKLMIEGELEKGKGEAYLVKGITPCSMDIFRYRAYLDNPKVGDRLVFLNAGAYNFSSDFCDLDKIETRVIKK